MLAGALAGNTVLRSLDVRMVAKVEETFETIGSMLLKPDATSKLAYMPRSQLKFIWDAFSNVSVTNTE